MGLEYDINRKAMTIDLLTRIMQNFDKEWMFLKAVYETECPRDKIPHHLDRFLLNWRSRIQDLNYELRDMKEQRDRENDEEHW